VSSTSNESVVQEDRRRVRVLVTGASGLIGSAVVHALNLGGFEVRGTSRRTHWVDTLDHICERRYLDLSESVTAARLGSLLDDVEVVVHCAGQSSVPRGAGSQRLREARTLNVHAAKTLAEHAAAKGVRRFIFISSVKVMGECSKYRTPFSDLDIPKPVDEYSIGKRDAELAIEEVAAATGLEVVVVRPPLVYGPGVKGNFLTLMKLVGYRVPFPVGAIDNARSMVFAGNLAHFIATCVDSEIVAGRKFFVSDGEDLSTADLLRRVGHFMGRPVRIISVPRTAIKFLGRTLKISAEIDRLIGDLQVDIGVTRDLVNWTPPFSLDSGMQATIRWYLDRQ
jgi:nucleoside-diphosphate-sugar epimerase